jgi:hypothetical protein
MSRALGTFGMAALFLAISPTLRNSVADAGNKAIAFIDAHGPYSYAVIVVMGLIAAAMVLRTGTGSTVR